jgi:hypothetical protein
MKSYTPLAVFVFLAATSLAQPLSAQSLQEQYRDSCGDGCEPMPGSRVWPDAEDTTSAGNASDPYDMSWQPDEMYNWATRPLP